MEIVKGFKVFRPDWSCRDKQYTCPGKFEEDVLLSICNKGMHFCENVADCFNYYNFDSNNKVAEVIAYGDVRSEGDKSCTNKLEIVREITWDEVLRLVNVGKDCTGLCNTGDCNTGDWNTGDWNTGNWNTGNRNTGNRNTGDCNTGNRNTGDCNTGNRNTGNRNTGDCNTGNRNTGDWNKSSFNSGCFNTVEHTINLFNGSSDFTYDDWLGSTARRLLNQIPKNVVEWIYESDMTDDEKEAHKSYKTTGGYLKILDESECGQIWWDGLNENNRSVIKDLPNFDADLFEKCTGIKVGD